MQRSDGARGEREGMVETKTKTFSHTILRILKNIFFNVILRIGYKITLLSILRGFRDISMDKRLYLMMNMRTIQHWKK